MYEEMELLQQPGMSLAVHPKGWSESKLGKLAKIERITVPPEKIQAGTTYVGLENIDSQGQFNEVRSVESGEIASSKFAFNERHLLYGKLRPYLKKIARPDFSGVCSTDILPIFPGANLDRGFLYYYLRQPHYIELATARSTGANLPRLSPKELAEFTIFIPPLEEQRRIAAILDKADAVRRKRKEAIALTEELLRSAFLDMFGDPVTNPKGWEVHRLDKLAIIQSGIAKGKKNDPSKTISIPYMRVANVQDGYIDINEIKELEVLPTEVNRYALKECDLLLTEGGDPDKLGRGAVWYGEIQPCIHQNHIFCVRSTQTLAEPEYLSALIGSDYGKKYFLRAAKQTTGIATINKTQLSRFPVLLPPLELQHKYTQFIRSLRSTRQHLNKKQEYMDNLFNSLLQRAFRGEL